MISSRFSEHIEKVKVSHDTDDKGTVYNGRGMEQQK
jgi:hypothetical protein